MIIDKKITFASDKATVWDLLTNPEKTKQYMFGCEVLSEWKVGSPINWKGKTEEGKDIIYVKGEVTEIDLGNKVSFTMFDPNMGLKDIPENYVRLTYDLESSGEETVLNLIQDFTGVENAQTRYEESVKGWDMVIDLMRGVLG